MKRIALLMIPFWLALGFVSCGKVESSDCLSEIQGGYWYYSNSRWNYILHFDYDMTGTYEGIASTQSHMTSFIYSVSGNNITVTGVMIRSDGTVEPLNFIAKYIPSKNTIKRGDTIEFQRK